ncbi:MAG TPA: hypothetical protein ENN41_02485 [Sediminispirochaeta sp.]|nr:hypothetical protein [Sediminispirochaeta sp.]
MDEIERRLRWDLQRKELLNELAHGYLRQQSVGSMIDKSLQRLSRVFPNYRIAYSSLDSSGELTVLSSVNSLGLTLVKVLTAQINGSIDCTSRDGAVFWISTSTTD